jgi:hypothetical protein
VEIVIGSRSQAVSAVPERDLIAVESEDLLFRVVLLDLNGVQHVEELSRIVFSAAGELHLAELHGQGGGPLPLAEHDVSSHRREEPPEVDARMLEEIPVFNGDDGMPDALGICS